MIKQATLLMQKEMSVNNCESAEWIGAASNMCQYAKTNLTVDLPMVLLSVDHMDCMEYNGSGFSRPRIRTLAEAARLKCPGKSSYNRNRVMDNFQIDS